MALETFFDIDSYNLTRNFSIDDFLRVAVDYEDVDHWFRSETEVLLVILYCIIILIGLTGNMIICLIICRNGNLKSSRNWYILNLSICEMMTCVLCMPFTLVRLTLKNWTLGLLLCKIVPTVQTTYVVVSVLTVVAIAVDRYRVIVRSVVRTNRKLKTKFIVPTIWLFGFLISLPLLLTHRIEDVPGVAGGTIYSICVEHWDSNGLLMLYTVALLVVHYLLPVVSIIILHILICTFLRVRINTRQASVREINRVKRNMASHRKNMYLLATIAVLFAVTWLPITLINILADFDQTVFEDSDFRLIHAICLLIAFSSVCINPIVYGWFNSNFRRDIRRLTMSHVSQSVDMVHYGETSTDPHRNEIVSTTVRCHLPVKGL